MKDELSRLIKERFDGHETDVDPGLWDAIQGQIGSEQLASSEEGLKDLFQDRFNGHEVPVDPAAWANISQQLGHGAAAGGAGVGTLAWVAAAVGVVVIAGASFFYLDRNEVVQEISVPAIELPAATTSAPAANAEPEIIEQVNPAAPVAQLSAEAIVSVQARAEIPAVAVPDPAEAQGPSPVTVAEVLSPDVEPQGVRIVENIIAELTTRVTQDVLAEAAERNTMDESSTAPITDPSVAEVEPLPVRELPKLFLPNTFTPNGDGVNDTYTVLDASAFERIMLRVYDVRNDRLVFSTNMNEPWTGEGCMDGYYLVAVEAMTTTGELVTQGKVVWLTRNTMH